MTNTNKKIDLLKENTKEENKAIVLIKKSIASVKESYIDFLAGGVYLLIQPSNTKESLWSVIKTADSDWQESKRQYQRRVASCYTLATRRLALFEGKTAEEIREVIKSQGFTASKILEIEQSYRNQKAESGKEAESKEEASEEASEEAESKEEKSISFDQLVKGLESLTKTEKTRVYFYFMQRGYFFELRKATDEEKKQVANLYK